MEITIKLPAKNKKGHFKRTERRLKIIKRLNDADPTAVGDLVQYMLDEMEVSAPPEADLHEFIMQLSEEEVGAIFNPPDSTVPPTNAV